MDIHYNKMNRVDACDENRCCGCMACAAACPQGAISKSENKRGFIVPFIDDSKCINCGLCLKVCDFKKEHDEQSNIDKAFSLVINDKTVLKNSTSGGAFTALSDIVLGEKGSIVGSVMEPDFTVHHVTTSNKAVRDAMRGSKYVQSDTDGVFSAIKEILNRDANVMFVGTPCQCGALHSYLGKEYDKLVVVDFLCHGVPNNKMFKEHIDYLNKYYGVPSAGFSFRNKTYGWDSYNGINTLVNGKTKTKWINQIYYSFFVGNYSLRLSCHQCPYRSLHRPSDITIADFWGIEKFTGHKDREGVSLVLTHSEKGLAIVEKAKVACQVKEYPAEAVAFRISLEPSKPNAKSDAFWKTYVEQGYKGVAKKYFINSRKNRIRFEVRKVAKKLRIG